MSNLDRMDSTSIIAAQVSAELSPRSMSKTSAAVASIDPFNALVMACHTSDRVFGGTIYTIADTRFPEINGRRVIKTLEVGRDVFAWYGEVK
jgi:hypothetical protein